MTFAGITLTLKKMAQLFQVSIHVDLCHPMPKYSPLVFKKDSKYRGFAPFKLQIVEWS